MKGALRLLERGRVAVPAMLHCYSCCCRAYPASPGLATTSPRLPHLSSVFPASSRQSRPFVATFTMQSTTTTTTSSAASPSSADAVALQKRALRSKIRKDLRAFSPSQRRQEDTSIQKTVLDSSWFKLSKSLCAYISCESLREVDTSKILSEVLGSSATGQIPVKKLYVPRVEDKNSHMRMLGISNIEDLVANSMNILEPSPTDTNGNEREDVLLANDPVDMFLLPGVAFDRSGRRLGRGGGYYDAFLKKYQELAAERKWKQPLLVALAYSVQIVDEGAVPISSHDVLIDALVSPSGVIRISPAAFERM